MDITVNHKQKGVVHVKSYSICGIYIQNLYRCAMQYCILYV